MTARLGFFPILVVEIEGRTLTWRFEDEGEMVKARLLARVRKVPFKERWGVAVETAAFTRRREYESALRPRS